MMQIYDVIGDVHGYGQKLDGLLDLLGWVEGEDGQRRNPDPSRQVVFVGDLIDRGEHQKAVLQTVRAMTDAGTAQIVMGNHEFNAIAYGTQHPEKPDEFLREHSDKNVKQHQAFLNAFPDGDERAGWIEWFRTLPLWLDLGPLRIVHACWHQPSIDLLETKLGGNFFPENPDLFIKAIDKSDPIGNAIEVILKGPEMQLAPYGLPQFYDKGSTLRDAARVRWWNKDATQIADLIDLPSDVIAEDGNRYPTIENIPCSDIDRSFAYTDAIPVLYGHHWRQWEPEEHLDWTSNTACVDFSAGNGGPLVAYQWSGETTINKNHFVNYPGNS